MATDTNQQAVETTGEPPIDQVPPRAEDRPWARRVWHRRSPSARRGLIIGAVLILLGTGIFLWRYLTGYESTDDAQVDVHLYPVSARITGHVIAVNVNDNQWVEKGTVLVEIDPRDYQVAVDRARADLAQAAATAHSLNVTVPVTSATTSSQLSSSAAGIEGATAAIAGAQKQFAAAQAQVAQAEANDVTGAERPEALHHVGPESGGLRANLRPGAGRRPGHAAAVEGARANEAAAQAAIREAKSRLAQARAENRAAQSGPQQVASSRARALSAAADEQAARAALEQAELNLQYTHIVAPVSGEVNKTVVVGMNVQPGQQLLTVVPLEEVWITANFKETQLKHMRPGQRVEITVDANGRTYHGHVDSIAGATGPLFSVLPPENATGNYVKIVQRIPVKIVLEPGENRDQQLRPGMSVAPKVYLAMSERPFRYSRRRRPLAAPA